MNGLGWLVDVEFAIYLGAKRVEILRKELLQKLKNADIGKISLFIFVGSEKILEVSKERLFYVKARLEDSLSEFADDLNLRLAYHRIFLN